MASGLTHRSVLEKFCAIQMIDVHLPSTDGRKVIMFRYTHSELQILLKQLRMNRRPELRPKAL